MEASWHFYRFDYERYLALRPALRSATTPAAFAALAQEAAAQAVVEALSDNAVTLPEARQLFVQAVCCLGDPLILDRGFPRFVGTLARYPGAEDAAQLLGEILAGKKNMEPWLLPATGLIGFLKPEETVMLHDSYRAFARRVRFRRGGLLGAATNFFRRLLDRAPREDEILRPLGERIKEAAERNEGLAVISGG